MSVIDSEMALNSARSYNRGVNNLAARNLRTSFENPEMFSDNAQAQPMDIDVDEIEDRLEIFEETITVLKQEQDPQLLEIVSTFDHDLF